MTDSGESRDPREVGYLCIQGYPRRICSGCTSACCERVYVGSGVSGDGPYANWRTDDLITRLAAPFPPPGEREAVADELRRRSVGIVPCHGEPVVDGRAPCGMSLASSLDAVAKDAERVTCRGCLAVSHSGRNEDQ